MVRRRTASPKPSSPVRSSPPPTMRLSPATRTISPLPVNKPGLVPMGTATTAPSQGPGLIGQMAATAGGVAIGSAVGHTVGHMLTSGSSSPDSAPAQASIPTAVLEQQAYSQPCEFEWRQFIDCTQNQSDVSLCNGFNEAFKQCKARYV